MRSDKLLEAYITLIIPFLAVAFVCMWKIFKKAGYPGWYSLIPIYGNIILLRIVKRPDWWLAMLCIPFINIIYLIMITNALAKRFNKDEGFTVGLLFLPMFFYPILAHAESKIYDEEIADHISGFTVAKEVNLSREEISKEVESNILSVLLLSIFSAITWLFVNNVFQNWYEYRLYMRPLWLIYPMMTILIGLSLTGKHRTTGIIVAGSIIIIDLCNSLLPLLREPFAIFQF